MGTATSKKDYGNIVFFNSDKCNTPVIQAGLRLVQCSYVNFTIKLIGQGR